MKLLIFTIIGILLIGGIYILTHIPDQNILTEETSANQQQLEQKTALEEWTIEGDKVFVDDDKIYASASPHTLRGSDWVVFNFTSKVYTGNVDVVLGFDKTYLQPQQIERFNPTTEKQNISYTCETDYFNYTIDPKKAWCFENVTEYITNTTYTSHLELIWSGNFDSGDLPSKTVTWEEDYLDIWKQTSLDFSSTNYEYGDMNKWYYTQDVPITQDTEYVFRVFIKNLDPFGPGSKYWFAIKPSSESLSEAVSSGHLYALDPWTDSLSTELIAYYNFSSLTESINGGDYNLINNRGTPELVSNTSCLNLEDQACGFVSNQVESWNVSIHSIFGLNDSNRVNSSYCLWVNRNPGSTGVFISKGNTDGGWMSSIHGGDNVIYFGPTNGSSNTTQAVPLTEKLWYHLCYARNDTHVGMYVNGTLTNVSEHLIPIETTDLLEIGGSKKHGSYIGGMYFDEMGFWNRTISSSEVSDLYNEGNGITYIPDVGITFTINLNSPIDNFNTLETEVNFSGSFSVTGTNANLTNASLYLWYGNGSLFGTNYTIINNTANATNRSFDGLQTNNYLWNYEVCANNDTGFECDFADANRSFQISAFTENESVFNNSVFETSLQGFWINITYDTGRFDDVVGSFWYNNTEYTDVEEIDNGGEVLFNITNLQTPTVGEGTNISFHWEIELDEGGSPITQNTTPQNQTLNQLFFDVCNETLVDIFLNVSFQNETIAEEAITALIPSSTITYWLGGATTNRSITYTNSTENLNYTFCGNATSEIINTLIELDYSNSESQQRSFIGEFALNSTVNTEQVLLLLPTSEGTFVTFQVVDVVEQVIDDVEVNVTFSGTLIETQNTNDAGLVTFFLDPDSTYTFVFTKDGYPQYTTSLKPTQTSYTVTLGTTSATTVYDFTQGITAIPRPQTGVSLDNSTNYEFNLTLTSSYWTVTEFGFTLFNGSSYEIGSDSLSSNGGFITDTANTGINNTIIIMQYYWIIDGNTTMKNVTWFIFDGTGTGFGLKNFFNRLSTYSSTGILGLNNFSLTLIVFLIIFVITGIMSYKFGIGNERIIATIFFSLVLIFDVFLGLMPSPGSIRVPFFYTIIAGIGLIAVFYWGAER